MAEVIFMASTKTINGALKVLGKKPAIYSAKNRKRVAKDYAWGKPLSLLAAPRNALAVTKRTTRKIRQTARRMVG